VPDERMLWALARLSTLNDSEPARAVEPAETFTAVSSEVVAAILFQPEARVRASAAVPIAANLEFSCW
jgi:hypothetical protein